MREVFSNGIISTLTFDAQPFRFETCSRFPDDFKPPVRDGSRSLLACREMARTLRMRGGQLRGCLASEQDIREFEGRAKEKDATLRWAPSDGGTALSRPGLGSGECENVNIKYRVVIAEDHELLRNGLRSMLSAQGNYDVIGEARDGKEAFQMAMTLNPDLMLMDLSMRGMNGIDASAAIKRRAPGMRIVALTVHQSEEYVREALRAGVDGYVLKDVSFDELLVAMRTVMQGKKHLSADVYGYMVDSFVTGREAAAPKKAWDVLTARERSVLKLIAEGRTNRQVGQYLNLSPKTIEKYRASMMHKLNIANLTELVLVAISMGLLASLASKCSEPDADDTPIRLAEHPEPPADAEPHAELPAYRLGGVTG